MEKKLVEEMSWKELIENGVETEKMLGKGCWKGFNLEYEEIERRLQAIKSAKQG